MKLFYRFVVIRKVFRIINLFLKGKGLLNYILLDKVKEYGGEF